MKLRYVFISVVLIGILVAATVFVIPKLVGTNETSDQTGTVTETTTPITTTPEIVSNKPAVTATTPITVPQEMQAVIDANAENLFVDASNELATDYPSQLVPLYGVLGISDSNQVTSETGKPGWKAAYVSDLTSDDILGFYQQLLSSASDFTEETVSSSASLEATVSGYLITITISPNIPEKTDLQGNRAVSISIEQV